MGTKRYITLILLFIASFAKGQGFQWLPVRIGATATPTFTITMTGSAVATPAGINTSTITSSGINTTGSNAIVIVVVDFASVALGTLTDSKSNSWSLAKSQTPGGANARVSLFYSNLSSSGSGHTFTYTTSGTSFPSLYIMTLSTLLSGGGVGTLTVDQTNGANTGSGVTSIQPGSITPTKNGELLISGLAAFPTTGVTSINSGFTIMASNSSVNSQRIGGGLAYLFQTTAASVNPTWVLTGSPSTSSAIDVSFKVQ